MTCVIRSAALAAMLSGVALAGCGGSDTPVAPTPAARYVSGNIVLTAVGAQRIGLQTAPALSAPAPAPLSAPAGARSSIRRTRSAAPARGPVAIIPLSAVVYAPSGRAYAFSSSAPLTYTEVPVTVDHVSGNSVYVLTGPRPGTQVVTVGAEELFGAQRGVIAQT